MKRMNNLYENIYKPENIMQAFDEVCRNMKNKKKVNSYKEFRCVYISRIYNDLKNRNYKVGPYDALKIVFDIIDSVDKGLRYSVL